MSEVAGYFIWERGLRGPTPVKISADRDQYLSRSQWAQVTVSPLMPLNPAQYEMSLDQLAAAFPCPEQPS